MPIRFYLNWKFLRVFLKSMKQVLILLVSFSFLSERHPSCGLCCSLCGRDRCSTSHGLGVPRAEREERKAGECYCRTLWRRCWHCSTLQGLLMRALPYYRHLASLSNPFRCQTHLDNVPQGLVNKEAYRPLSLPLQFTEVGWSRLGKELICSRLPKTQIQVQQSCHYNTETLLM